jgi:uncharacterized membrane protein
MMDAIHNRLQGVLGHCALLIGCHQRIDRSYVLRGRQIPLCCRCLGTLFGIAFAPLFVALSPILCTLLVLPLVADGMTQLLGLRESRNWLRLITGVLFGIAAPNVLIRIARYLF